MVARFGQAASQKAASRGTSFWLQRISGEAVAFKASATAGRPRVAYDVTTCVPDPEVITDHWRSDKKELSRKWNEGARAKVMFTMMKLEL